MINRQALLSDLQRLVRRIEADLIARSDSSEVPEVAQFLRKEYERARKSERTARTFKQWVEETATQHAAAWVLSCVFVRFLEDNQLVAAPKLSGPGDRRDWARDEHELYFRKHPTHSDRDYLLHIFDELAELPATRDVFGPHNPLRDLPQWLGPDVAGELVEFFRRFDPETGLLIHDFTDPDWDTRFLGDLYQDLSEAARKNFALLQTPEFVEEFILDRTLEPALDEFGLEPTVPDAAGGVFRMIDPACGSGHFLLGAFPRILDRWQQASPGTPVAQLVQKTLDSIHGVDVNPYAVAITRFRLLLAALKACGETKLAGAPQFTMNLACGDSLYHGRQRQQHLGDWTEETHTFRTEDADTLRRILREETYHCVVANPPYITPKDKAANKTYRELYTTCHMKYSLAVPFMERIFRLAVAGNGTPAGYTGQITANSFMKREFGKKLIEQFLPKIDLTHVVDTSGAYIPGHGTPTVILFGRHRKPQTETIRTVMGIRGEPSTPDDPARGLVWSAIVRMIDTPAGDDQLTSHDQLTSRDRQGADHAPSTSADRQGAEPPTTEQSAASLRARLVQPTPARLVGPTPAPPAGTAPQPGDHEFISVADVPRERFGKHPWSIGGGGAAELKEKLEQTATETLKARCESIGFMAITGEDDIFLGPLELWKRLRSPSLEFGVGDCVRDWMVQTNQHIAYMYQTKHDILNVMPLEECGDLSKAFWSYRTNLKNRLMFGKLPEEAGLKWFEYRFKSDDRLRTPLSIVFAFVATHNHFVLDRGGKVFKQSAPVIKLPEDATEDDHLALLGLLNSSTACFWMKQVFHDKGSTVDSHGARQTTVAFENFREFTGTGLLKCPIPEDASIALAKTLDTLAQRLTEHAGSALLNRLEHIDRESLEAARQVWLTTRREMIALQEDLDWDCYRRYGLIDEDLTWHGDVVPIELGQRAFEIVMARKMAAGTLQTTWFERHGSTPITDIPDDWPEEYRQLVQRRIDVIEQNPEIRLIEQPEYKRRWNMPGWDQQLQDALRLWLTDRLESYFDFDGRMNDEGKPTAKFEDQLVSVARIADEASRDEQFLEVGALYRDDIAFDVQKLVAELVAAESVPLLPVLRYKPSGLRKRKQWEETWELQRREDAGEEVGDIPVPPKYTSSDFISTGGARYWALRGKLDVPKERWISFPHCEADDGSLVVCWAGYDHLQQARAISAYFVEIQEKSGGRDDPRLEPLLAAIVELLPWLRQWHNDPDPEFGISMADYFDGFVTEEARALGRTKDDLREWQPPKKTGRGRSRKK